ncbi:CHASE3 domain-containing protein [Streptomyces sp. NBC_01317]|uniref:sensor histidine kinase n=1 Tax=Streptomyces sp. NBC_01317 TaxID=2903822 RepID=UPI002E0FD729|nr:CHASE3 domain-containing protein [Streptomyces sp. NBC_01317]
MKITGKGHATVGRAVSGWTTRRWLVTGTSLALVVLLGLSLCGAWVFARSTAINNRLVDRSSPALIASVQLESALINQETGIRGYGITGQADFLAPYRDGLARQKSSVRQLRLLTGEDKVAARDLAEVDGRARQWQARIARPVAESSAPVPLARERAEEGRRLFDSLRTAMSAQQNHLQVARAEARADLQGARTFRNWTFTAMALVILALAGLVFVGLRRGVTSHLDRLSLDVRKVAGGDFAHSVAGSGPADLRLLAADVESMRTRLAAELSFSETAQASLATQAEELRRSNSELEQFAYVASHDLQEPLRKVASFCQLLERRYAENLDDRGRQYIAFAVDGANRMQGLISDLLGFSRIGRLLTEHVDVDLDELFDRTVDSLGLAIEESGSVVTHDPLPVLQGEKTQLGMLLQNLIGNAVKFRSADRPPVIHLGARRVDAGWEFAITDNGIGIAPEFAERVFVVFQRLHTREQYSGNGIGLALCRKIVEYHGGSIGIDHTHSPGTRIVFTLADTMDAGAPRPAQGQGVLPPPARGGGAAVDQAAPSGQLGPVG